MPRVLLYGPSQVGKSTVGKEVARVLDIPFYDLDYDLMDIYGSIEEFQKQYPHLLERYYKKADMMIEFANNHQDCVLAVSPLYDLGVIDYLRSSISDSVHIHLTCTKEALFSRSGIYDEKGVKLPYSDEYMKKYRNHYLRECNEEINCMNYYLSGMYKITTTNDDVNGVVRKVLRKVENTFKSES